MAMDATRQRSATEAFELPDDLADWERTQAKTFAKWANLYLGKRGMSLSNFNEDLKSGVKLINLIEVISDHPLGKYNKNPRSKIQNIENLQLPVTFINSFLKEVKLQVSYSAENIIDNDFKQIMGMIFCLIHKFEINSNGLDGKDGLLLWCQKNTKGYANVDVQNFSNSWKDGLAFAALIHKFRPDMLDFASLKPGNALHNLQTAFEAASKLGIPQLLDAEDIAMAAKPDDKAVMTQLAHYWKVLSQLAKSSVGKERVAAVLGRFKQNQEMATSYADEAKKLQDWIRMKTQEFEKADFGNSVAEVQAKLSELNKYFEDVKPEKTKDKLNCAGLLRSLHAKQRVERAPVFNPPAELTPEATETLWGKLLAQEVAYNDAAQKALALARAREKEIRRLEGRIAKLQSWMTAQEEELATGKLGESRWETEGFLRMHDAVAEEIAANKARVADVTANAPKFPELAAKAEAVVQGMKSLDTKAAARKTALQEQLQKHVAFEAQQLDHAAKIQKVFASLEDTAEILEQPMTNYTKHDIALCGQTLDDVAKQLENAKSAVEGLLAESKALGDKPNPFVKSSATDVKARFDELMAKLASDRAALSGEESGLHKLDALKKEFADAAEGYDQWLSQMIKESEATDSGELEEQLAKCTAKMKETESDSQTRLDKLRDLKHVLAEAGETVGESNPFTQLTLPGLVTKTESMLKTFLDKADVLNGRIAAKKGMEITPAQLEELKQSFNFFDKHHRGGLDMTEFAQCQESLGQELPESQLKEVFDKHSTDGFVSFNQFLTYMQTIMRVTDSYEDILQALQSVNGDTIPPPGLAALLSPEVAAYIIPLAPKNDSGDIVVKELLAMVFDVSK